MTAAEQKVTSQFDDADEGHAPRWLIGLVVVLGLAFLAMLTIIVVKLLNGDGPMAAAETAAATEPAVIEAPLSTEAVRDFKISRPEGATLVRTELTGREILMHFRTAEGSDILVVLNRMTGQESRVVVAP